MQQKYLTREQGLQKLKQYCAYQERSHAEVQQKLWDLGVRKVEHDEIISALIEENYLNEERFAKAFAGGKFRMKDWGKKKIIHALRDKGVSEYNIRKAMQEIDEDAYEGTARELAEKKYAALRGEQYLIRKKKTIDFLLRKGYDYEMVNRLVASLASGEKD